MTQLEIRNLLYPEVDVPRFISFAPTTEYEGIAAVKWSCLTSNKKSLPIPVKQISSLVVAYL